MLFETQKIMVVPFEDEAQWEDVFRYMSSPVVAAFTPTGPFSEEEAENFVQYALKSDSIFAIVLREENKIIGHLIFREDYEEDTYEVGWFIDEAYHGKGLGSEALGGLLIYAFSSMEAHRLVATTQPGNTACIRLLERNGFTKEGHFRKASKNHQGEWDDDLVYAILEEDYEKLIGDAPVLVH